MDPSVEKEALVINVDLGNRQTKAVIDLLDPSKRDSASCPPCFKKGPLRPMLFATRLFYLNKKVVDWDAGNSMNAQEATPCTDFVWSLSSHYKDESKTEEVQKKPPWQHTAARIYKDDEDLVVDFLGRLYKHLEKESYGKPWGEDNFEWRFVFSVPASFTVEDKQKFEDLVKRCNRHNSKENRYIITRQSEAAAICALHMGIHSKKQVPEEIEDKINLLARTPYKRKGFIICDVSGRKIEITSHHAKILEGRARVIRTAAENICNRYCGSDTIDNEYLGFLQDGIENPFEKLSFMGKDAAEDLERCLDSFREEKNKMKAPGDIYVKLFGKGRKHRGCKDGFVFIPRKKFESFYSPCIKQTLEHLEEHVQETKALGIDIEFVVLVGGLASSEYFVEQITSRLLDANIRVWAPKDPETVIAKGMALDAQQTKFRPRETSNACYGLVNSNGRRLHPKIVWFFLKGESYRSKRIRLFKHPINVSKAASSPPLKLKIVRYSGDPSRKPKKYSKKLEGADILKVKPVPVNIKDPSSGNSWMNYANRGGSRNLIFHFDVSDLELRFLLKDDKNQDEVIATWDDTE